SLHIADRDYFIFHIDRATEQTHVGAPLRGRDARETWFLPVSRRLTAANGAFDGVVAGAVRPTYFSDFHERIGLGAAGYIRVVNQAGVVLAQEPDGIPG